MSQGPETAFPPTHDHSRQITFAFPPPCWLPREWRKKASRSLKLVPKNKRGRKRVEALLVLLSETFSNYCGDGDEESTEQMVYKICAHGNIPVLLPGHRRAEKHNVKSKTFRFRRERERRKQIALLFVRLCKAWFPHDRSRSPDRWNH